MMEKNCLYRGEEKNDQDIYDYIDDFYEKYGRAPNTIELYQTFLNYKSHQLRGKMNTVKSRHPNYYKK